MSRSWCVRSALLLVLMAVVLSVPQPAWADVLIPSSTLQSVAIAPGPEQDRDPVVGLTQNGQIVVSWVRQNHDEGTVSLCVARPPSWDIMTLSQHTADQPLVPPQIWTSGSWVMWAWRSEQGIEIEAFDLLQEDSAFQTHLSASSPIAITIDSQGNLYSASVQPDALLCVNHTTGTTATLPLEPGATVSDLHLVTDATNDLYLLLAIAEPTGERSGLYVSRVSDQQAPTFIAPQASRAQMAPGVDGQVHLGWIERGNLFYCSLDDRLHPVQLASGLGEEDSFALGAGIQGAQMIWTQNTTLWRADAVAWSLAQQIGEGLGQHSPPAMIVDDQQVSHLVWSVQQEDGDQDIVYMTPKIPAQVKLRYPVADTVLVTDTLIMAETTLTPDELGRLDFYLQGESSARDMLGGWRLLGSDLDGKDGWSFALSIGDLDVSSRYHLMVIGTTALGQTIRALGGWFRAQRIEQDPVWLIPSAETIRESSYLTALTRPYPGLNLMDLYLVPADCATSQRLCPAVPMQPSSAYYVGAFALPQTVRSELVPQRLLFNTLALPNGDYQALAASTDGNNQTHLGLLSQPFRIDNGLEPEIAITRPLEGSTVSSQIVARALITDWDGSVLATDFYLQREFALLDGDASTGVPQRVWLGRDDNPNDGWQVARQIESAWDGDWYLLAQVTDRQGYTYQTISRQPFRLVSNALPLLRFSRPAMPRYLHDQEEIVVYAYGEVEHIARIVLYAQDASGRLILAGTMEQDMRKWSLVWDTLSVADGMVDLVALAYLDDGRVVTIKSLPQQVDNTRPTFSWASPAENERVTGIVPIQLKRGCCALATLETIDFYLQDVDGELVPLGRDASNGTWGITWNTRLVLDGAYEIVALLNTQRGTSALRRTITVANMTPQIAFDPIPEGIWEGTRTLAWSAVHPTQQAMSVTLRVSPDDGLHWLPIGQVGDTVSDILWDTSAFPDSSHVRLRLTASDGLHTSQTTSPPLAINNTNEPPRVQILGLQPDVPQSGPLVISWSAWDPDGDALRAQIDYQAEGENTWTLVARDLENTGKYIWTWPEAEESKRYSLRVTVTDSEHSRGTDQVRDVLLVPNKPPEVSLLWPNSQVLINGEAAILWRASDPDGDPLEIDLFYSDNAGKAWLPLAERVPNTGYFVWQVSFLPQGKSYRVRIVARDSYFQSIDESDRVFSIGKSMRPLLMITTPLAHEPLSGIRWVEWRSLTRDCTPITSTLSIRRSQSQDWQTIKTISQDQYCFFDTATQQDGDYDLRVLVDYQDCAGRATATQAIAIRNQANKSPTVKLLSPQGGETWAGLHPVTWQAWDADSSPITATLAISHNDGQEWTSIAQIDGRQGMYLWDTSSIPAGPKILLRILISDGSATARDISRTPFAVTHHQGHPPTIRIASLNPEGILLDRLLSWSVSDVDGDSASVHIEASADQGHTWQTLARSSARVGQYDLTPEYVPAGARIRVRANDGIYTSEAIAIFADDTLDTRQPKLYFLDPQNPANWSGVRTVKWRYEAPATQTLTLAIHLSADGGLSWPLLADGLQGSQQYEWDTTALANGTYHLRISARTDLRDLVATSMPIVIDNPGNQRPQVSLISPQNADIWSGLCQIQWRAHDVDHEQLSIDLDYSLDRGQSWTAIAHRLDNVGHYVWDSSLIPNSSQVWLSVTASDGHFSSTAVTINPMQVRNPLSPVVRLLVPRSGALWHGRHVITWETSYLMLSPISVRIENSLDDGKTWRPLATDLPATGDLIWDTSLFPEASHVLLRAIASDGNQYGLDTIWEPIVIYGNRTLPSITGYPN